MKEREDILHMLYHSRSSRLVFSFRHKSLIRVPEGEGVGEKESIVSLISLIKYSFMDQHQYRKYTYRTGCFLTLTETRDYSHLVKQLSSWPTTSPLQAHTFSHHSNRKRNADEFLATASVCVVQRFQVI